MTCSVSDRHERRDAGHLPSRDVTKEQEPKGEDRGEMVKQGKPRNHHLKKKKKESWDGAKEVVRKTLRTHRMYFFTLMVNG